MTDKTTMRDSLIEEIYRLMNIHDNIFFISADMGAPSLDKLRKDHSDRFINVGIAEQNMINVATGLALEGFTVFTYAIASFIMRAYEQIRINLALSSQERTVNVNFIGVGGGVSYDVSGPTHHCLEDLTIMRTLPNIEVFSPSDSVLAGKYAAHAIETVTPSYARFDGKPLASIYSRNTQFNFEQGFHPLRDGEKVCIVSTGYMTHKAIQIINDVDYPVSLIDVFLLKPFDEEKLMLQLGKYDSIITMEEGFIGKGGLDTLVLNTLNKHTAKSNVYPFGFLDTYLFKFGSREYLYQLSQSENVRIIELLSTLYK